jgi:hypothetical protein
MGGSYVARSVNAACDRMVNLFAEAIEEGGNEAAFMNRAPCISLLATVGNGPIRGLWKLDSQPYLYVVSGNELYKIDASYNETLIGSVTGSSLVSMADNGTQIFIANGVNSYIYNTSTGAFGQITDPDFTSAKTVSFLDSYFVYTELNSQKLWITALLDGTSIDPLDFSSAEGSPDYLVGGISDHREYWAFGTNSTEVYYNSGTGDFPLQRIQGAFNEVGCLSAYSICKMDNSIVWLGSDDRGQGMVYRADGYIGQRISTHAVEYKIAEYARTSRIDDAVAYTYQQEGHIFYVLTFPTADATWVYDAATKLWHERGSWVNGAFKRHRGQCHVMFNGVSIVGDYENGNLYQLSLNTYSDSVGTQRCLRAWRALGTGQNNFKRSIHHSLELRVESGVGLSTGQGEDPQVCLRFSDDGGHTWSNENWRSIGRIGEYGNRVIWRRLGMSEKLRDRVYEVSFTDPVKLVITGAELSVEETRA